ncbi:hypothetical protein [Streptomyces sp. NPDC006134]
MLKDPYAVLHALLRAEAARSTPKPGTAPRQGQDQRPAQRPATGRERT